MVWPEETQFQELLFRDLHYFFSFAIGAHGSAASKWIGSGRTASRSLGAQVSPLCFIFLVLSLSFIFTSQIWSINLDHLIFLLRSALQRLEHEAGQDTRTLRLELDQATSRLRAYEALEEEIDSAVVRTAGLNGSSGAEGLVDGELLLFTFIYCLRAFFLPTKHNLCTSLFFIYCIVPNNPFYI